MTGVDTTITTSGARVEAHSLTTPAGLQANATLNARRAIVLTLNLLTWGLLLAWFASILASGGWSLLDCVLFACFVFGSPWTVLGFWNAIIGLWQLHRGSRSLNDVAPFLSVADNPEPLSLKTAVLMTLRNEDPSRALLRLQTVKASLDATGEGGAFNYFVLSDTDQADVASAEQDRVEAWRAADSDRDRIVYRRRLENFTRIKTFIKVVEAGSFSAAARDESSVSTVARQVKSLEDELGVRLLNRTTRRLALTDTGRRFYERVSEIDQELKKAKSEVSSTEGRATAMGRLSAPAGTAAP